MVEKSNTQKNTSFTVDFIGVGAPRCGTTWISKCLAEHPEICFSKEKEVHFFDRPYIYNDDLEKYKQFFISCQEDQVCGEFTPAYYLDETIAKRIVSYFEHVKIIVVLRNPIDRAFSNFKYQRNRIGTKLSFEEHIRSTSDRVTEAGLYYKYLSVFLPYFRSDQVHVILHEEAKQEPARVVKELYTFLGVTDSYIPASLSAKVNAADSVQYTFPVINRFINLRKSIKHTRAGQYLILACKKLGVNYLVQLIMRLNSKTTPLEKESISPSARAFLQAFYADDVRKLSILLEKDFSGWHI